MPIVTDPDTGELRLECVICEARTELEDMHFEAVAAETNLRSDPSWYLHIHDVDGITIDPDDTAGFCPDHLPETPFPTSDTADPDFDLFSAIADLQAEFNGAQE